jgi:hypothetical protein
MASRDTFWVVPLVAIGLIVGMAFTIFLTPAIGVPLLVLAALVGAIGRLARHATPTGRMEDFRDQARSDVEFTERDRATLTTSQGDQAGT